MTYDTSELDMQVKQSKLDLEGLNNDLESQKKELNTLNEKYAQTTDEDDKFELQTVLISRRRRLPRRS